jgi:hypothetical protein
MRTNPRAGNAPFIVDREDGRIHVTGTAFPTEFYLENYARTGVAFPQGLPEHTVILEGWKPGKPVLPKISLTKAIRRATGKGLAESKSCTGSVLSGEDVALMFATTAEAENFAARMQEQKPPLVPWLAGETVSSEAVCAGGGRSDRMGQ